MAQQILDITHTLLVCFTFAVLAQAATFVWMMAKGR